MIQQTKVKQLSNGWKEDNLSLITEEIKNKGEIGKLPYIEIGDIDLENKGYSYKDKKSIEGSKEANKEDVIISKVRPTRGAISIIKEDTLNVSNAFCILRNKEIIIPKYLFYFLNQRSFLDYLGSKEKGTVYPSCKSDDILNYKIRFPESKEEQQLIVSAIETQFSRLDESVKVLKSVKDKLEVYRRAVLKVVFSGDSWEYSKIGKIFKTSSGGTPSRANKLYYTGNIPWLKSGELMDKTNIEESEEYISKEALEKSSAKIFPIDTTLIAMYGATTGKIGIIKKECSTNQAICGIFPNQDSISKFIFYYLLFKRERIINQSKGGAQPNINQEIIRNLDFPLLSKNIQQKIVQEIESKFSVIDKVEEGVNQSLVKAEALRKSILKSAFEGKLIKFEEIKNV